MLSGCVQIALGLIFSSTLYPCLWIALARVKWRKDKTMTDQNEVVQSSADANVETSSASPEQTANTASANEAKQESANTPFHEHPRFKELIEERNQWKNQFAEMQKRLSDFESRSKPAEPKVESPEDNLLKELKQIRPEFGNLIETLMKKASKVEEIEAGFNNYRNEQLSKNVSSTLEKLHAEHKVPAELQDTYRLHLKAMADANPSIGLSDLPKLYKEVHDRYSKIIDGIKRSATESYLTSKKADASIPTNKPATVAKSTAPSTKPKSREEAKAEFVSVIANELRAAKRGV